MSQLNPRRDGRFESYTEADEIVRLDRDTVKTINNITDTLIDIQNELQDDPGWFTLTSPTVVTVNKECFITVTAGYIYAVNTNGLRSLVLKHNGVIVDGETCLTDAAVASRQIISADLHVQVNDTLEFETYQNRGGTLGLNVFTAEILVLKTV